MSPGCVGGQAMNNLTLILRACSGQTVTTSPYSATTQRMTRSRDVRPQRGPGGGWSHV